MELCTSNSFETVIVLSAEDFLGEFDAMRYHPLMGYGNSAEDLMAGVYLSDFWEWLALEARQDGRFDTATDQGLALYHRQLTHLSDLAFELRTEMDEFARCKLEELGYQRPVIQQIYFNTHNAFVRIG